MDQRGSGQSAPGEGRGAREQAKMHPLPGNLAKLSYTAHAKSRGKEARSPPLPSIFSGRIANPCGKQRGRKVRIWASNAPTTAPHSLEAHLVEPSFCVLPSLQAVGKPRPQAPTYAILIGMPSHTAEVSWQPTHIFRGKLSHIRCFSVNSQKLFRGMYFLEMPPSTLRSQPQFCLLSL